MTNTLRPFAAVNDEEEGYKNWFQKVFHFGSLNGHLLIFLLKANFERSFIGAKKVSTITLYFPALSDMAFRTTILYTSTLYHNVIQY
jgi:hypothetical protein